MSNRVFQGLNLFDSLPDADKQSRVVEIIRRSPSGGYDILVNGFDDLADELFAGLDADEDACASH